MLTPTFNAEQNEEYVILTIHAPYTKVSDVEVFVDNETFTFYAKPYFLRLKFSGNLLDEESVCKYLSDSGDYSVKLKKFEKGVEFENLDLLTTLLEVKHKNQPVIEVVGNDSGSEISQKFDPSNIEWCNETCNDVVGQSESSFGYGFANQKHEVISKLQDYMDIVYISNPDKICFAERKVLREEAEEMKFDSDHYLADLYEDDEIKRLLSFKPWWETRKDQQIIFTEDEKRLLQSFPNKEYLLNDHEHKCIYLGILDILFGYAYHVRTTEDDNENLEAAWTIRTLSSTLSWCETQTTIHRTLVACVRRALCYPLYRNWILSEKIIDDVKLILKGGRRSVLRCLLAVFTIFKSCSDSPCYILNDLYILDFCVWLQKTDMCDETLNILVKAINDYNIKKADVNLDLECIERAAELVLQESEQEEESDSSDEGDTSSSNSDEETESTLSCDEDLVQAINEISISEKVTLPNTTSSGECAKTREPKPLIEVISESPSQ